MKTVAVSEDTWRKLKELKEKMGFSSYNELINLLIEKWHLISLKEELSKIDVNIDMNEARRFIKYLKLQTT